MAKRRRDEDDIKPAERSKRRRSRPTPEQLDRLQVIESKGNLFEAESGSLIVHACNCQGAWGAGIAAAFKAKYPAAFQVYAEHCDEHDDLLGSCLLIPPQTESESASEREASHWIGCLFTSVGRGKSLGSKQSILKATDTAVRQLLEEASTSDIASVKMCKINSGLFRVEWAQTKKVLEAIAVSDRGVRSIQVISRD